MSNSNSGGVGILGLLGVVFVVLKLMGYITWSWWYVTMPFWFGFALLGVILGVMLGLYVVYIIFDHINKKANKG